MENKTITIKIGGEAGFGIKVAGASLGKVFLRMGYEMFDYTEYPSLIRGGHNTFEITIGQKVYHHIRPVNLLIALNQKSIDDHMEELSADAGIIYDPDRIKVTSNNLTNKQGHKFFPVPLSQILKETGGSDLMKNTVALGATLAVLGANLEGFLDLLRQTFGKKSPKIVDDNIKAAQGGYDFVKNNFKEVFAYQVEHQTEKDQIYISGNEAVALGAIACGVKAYFGYPMTPSSSLLVYMAKNGPKYGILVRQPEDEISVLNGALGASFTGARAMVGTSGGGFSLMTEALGLSGITETPITIFMGQRPGPATGLPTWSGQADLRFLMHAAQDEFPRMIIAPGDHEECFYLTAQALNFAEIYQMPVFVLSDKNLAEGGKTVAPFDQSRIKIERGEWATAEQIKKAGKYLRYKVTESGISPRALPGVEGGMHAANSDEHDEYGYNNETSTNRNAQHEKRMRKLETALKVIPDPILYGPKDADLTIVSWGSTKGAILQAMEDLRDKSVNFLHFTYLWPFPTEGAVRMLKSAKKLMVIESNITGQFEGMIRQYVGRAPELNFRKYDGRPFWPHEIGERIVGSL